MSSAVEELEKKIQTLVTTGLVAANADMQKTGASAVQPITKDAFATARAED
jgi:hypothetical protein